MTQLDNWIDKIIKNAQNKELSKKDREFVIKENLKAFVQDEDVVKIGITERNYIYLWIDDER